MITYKQKDITTIFVDCFDTIIYRNTAKKNVFKLWAKDLSQKYNIPWKIIYKKYTKTNFSFCFKKIFKTLTLQENFEVVLESLYNKLAKKYSNLEKEDFLKTSYEVYFQKELDCFYLNTEMVDFLKNQKKEGKKIYLVSDFYCKSNTLRKWFEALKIDDIFDQIFSSSDFNKEKATKKIYKHLIKYLQLNPKNIIMFGDNIWSDVMMAKSCHLNAQRVKKQRRNNG